jgi:CHRD domain
MQCTRTRFCGIWYVNVHTTENRDGAIRGQIVSVKHNKKGAVGGTCN